MSEMQVASLSQLIQVAQTSKPAPRPERPAAKDAPRDAGPAREPDAASRQRQPDEANTSERPQGRQQSPDGHRRDDEACKGQNDTAKGPEAQIASGPKKTRPRPDAASADPAAAQSFESLVQKLLAGECLEGQVLPEQPAADGPAGGETPILTLSVGREVLQIALRPAESAEPQAAEPTAPQQQEAALLAQGQADLPAEGAQKQAPAEAAALDPQAAGKQPEQAVQIAEQTKAESPAEEQPKAKAGEAAPRIRPQAEPAAQRAEEFRARVRRDDASRLDASGERKSPAVQAPAGPQPEPARAFGVEAIRIQSTAEAAPMTQPATAPAPAGGATAGLQGAEAAREAPLTDQIAETFESRAIRGGDRVEIRLNPPELGRVRVEFHSDGNGVRGVLRVESRQTMNELQREAPLLINRLSDSGVQIRRLEVVLQNQTTNQQGQGEFGSFFQQQGQRHGGGQAGGEAGGFAPETVEDEPQPALVGDDAINVWM